MSADQGLNQSVERATSVLATFLDAGADLRVSDVAQRAGLGQSTTSRLLATLEQLEYVERDPATALYRLGPAVVGLAGAAVNRHPVHREARQRAQELACATGLGANVAVRRGASLSYLCNFEGRLAPRSFTLMGQRKPLHATGLGKCLLLGLGPAQRRELLPDLPRFTAQTLTGHDALDAELAAVAERGYAVEREELALGRACVAAPVRDHAGEVVAGISISGPLSAIDLPAREAELGRRIVEVADAISVGLGYVGPRHQSATDDGVRS
ncbi:IclR family transcriptional regulator [Pseudonocardia sichuanensis]